MIDRIVLAKDAAAAARAAAVHIAEHLRRAVAERGEASWVLAGGSTPLPLYRSIAAEESVPWRQVTLWFGDERFVPPDDPHSNYRSAREALLGGLPERPVAVHPMVLPKEAQSPDGAFSVQRYEDLLRRWNRPFDVTLLGLGADGHTASLFPGALPPEDHHLVAQAEAPAAPRARITLTLEALRRSRGIVFLVTGEGKAPALRRVLAARPEAPDCPPAARVWPASGPMSGSVSGVRRWFVDLPALVGA